MYSLKPVKSFPGNINVEDKQAVCYLNQKASRFLFMCFVLIVTIQASVVATPPAYQAAGTVKSGTGAVTPTWPTHQAGDVALLIVETANQSISLSTPAGFAEVTNSPQGTGTAGGTSATRLAVYWKRATTSSESNPTVADSGDHQIAQIITFRGVIDSGNPWDVTVGSVASSASTAVSIPGATTTVGDTLIVTIVANATDTTSAQTSGWTNANLTSLTERLDENTKSGNGGGFGIATGEKTVAGAYGTTTSTLATSSVQAKMSISLKPVSAPDAATNPAPSDTATDVSVNADLSWTAGSGASSHDVYFGTSNPPSFIGNQAGATYDPGSLTNNTTYYWRIDEVNAGGTTTGTVWSFTTIVAAPGSATSPSPTDSGSDIAVDADLSWTAGTGATSHDVYFGTSSPGTFQGNQAGTAFDPGTLVNDTTYYWRIDEVNAGGTTTGTVWSFTTIVAAPGSAASPSPADSGSDIAVDADLSWTAGTGATSHDVYFGTSSPGTFQGNQAGATFDPGTLANNTTYYWRIDEVNAGGTTTGTVWSFATIVAAPSGATSPSPSDSATDIATDTDLSWTAGSGATSHDVYFGTSSPGTFQGNQAGTTFDPGTLVNNTTYYWRIDEVNAGGTTTGTVWSFDTVASAPNTAVNPSPENSSVDVMIDIDLTWSAGSGATSHDVYFGTSSPGTFQGNQAGTSFDPGILTNDTTYYWRIDEVNAYGTTTGTVWSFATAPDGIIYVDINASDPNADGSTWVKAYSSIQTAINSASGGEKILVAQGTYPEIINFGGKAVHLTSTDPNDPDVIAATVIDAQNTSARVIDIISGEGADTVLEGITVTGGKHGIYVNNSFPTIRKCVFKDHAQYGMYLSLYSASEMTISECITDENILRGICAYATSGASLEISRCVINGDLPQGWSGSSGYGVYCQGNITLKNCVISNNSSGVYNSSSSSNLHIENCTIVGNATNGVTGLGGSIVNSILWENSDDINGAAYTSSYCCVQDGDAGTGNISSNPKFVDVANYNFHLAYNSPCIDAGDPNSSYANEPYGGGDRINMGAYGNTEEAKVVLDNDGDGIVDDWELLYWPGDDPNQHDPGDDPDGDLLINLVEYLIEWDPTENDSSQIPGYVTNPRKGCKYPSINYAFDYAVNGDPLVVDPNRFTETIDFDGKAIRLTSTDPNDPAIVAATIIDANNASLDVVTISSGETSASILEGFTITGGKDGIYVDSSSTPTIRKCITEGNSQDGMNIHVYSGPVEISECVSQNNTRYGFRGHGDVVLKNSLFVDNSSWGIYVTDGWSSFNIENCTIANNSSYGLYGQFDSIKNSILWGNGNDVHNAWSSYTISYCCVEDGDSGTGNVSLNPQFADAANGDYHLKSVQGRWNGASWTTDGVDSPCIDAAEPWGDYSSEPTGANGSRLNLGAYGNTAKASKSVDSDADGMSDVWEMVHFGTLNQDPNGISGNYDDDDFDNIVEYYFNYDPNAVTTVDTEILNLGQSASSFDPTLGETITFSFWINKPLQLILKNADSNDIFYDTQTAVYPGYNQIVWDGTGDADNLIVLKGNYDWALEDAAATPTFSVGSKDDSGDALVPISLTYDNSVNPLYCSPLRLIPTYNEVESISYGINLGDSFSQWPMYVEIYDPDGNLFYTVLDGVNQNKSASGTDLRTVTWFGKNGPPDEVASRYPSKTGKYTIKVRFSGMRECKVKTVYIYK